jgi:hypothetical protein
MAIISFLIFVRSWCYSDWSAHVLWRPRLSLVDCVGQVLKLVRFVVVDSRGICMSHGSLYFWKIRIVIVQAPLLPPRRDNRTMASCGDDK